LNTLYWFNSFLIGKRKKEKKLVIKNKVNTIAQDINNIEQIDKIKSKPLNELDFTTQDRLYSEVK